MRSEKKNGNEKKELVDFHHRIKLKNKMFFEVFLQFE